MRTIRFALLSITALSAFSVYSIVVSSDPHLLSLQLMITFNVSLFFFLTGFLTYVQISFYSLVTHHPLHTADVLPMLRGSGVIALVTSALLLLQALRSLSWWDAALIIAAAILFEMFFRVRIPIRTESLL